MRKLLEFKCLECGKTYFRALSNKKEIETRKYCSRECWRKAIQISDMKAHIRENSIEDGRGCWRWLKSYGPGGYGCATLNGKKINAHRLSYKVFKGEIPEGMCICHSCDNPSCVNPDHLFIGSIKDNVEDKIKKGRQKEGCDHANSKLSPSDILEIRENVEKLSHLSLARKFDVSKTTISRILKFRTYQNIGGEK